MVTKSDVSIGRLVSPLPSPTNEPVKSDAVTALVTFNELSVASEPDTMTFFHDGINNFLYIWVGYNFRIAHFFISIDKAEDTI